MRQPLKTSDDGYSLIEVIVVVGLIVIIAAIAISRSSDLSAGLATQTDILRTHLRYAQTLATSGVDSDVFGIKCDTNEYWLFKGNNPDSNVTRLTGDAAYDTDSDNKLDLSEKSIAISSAFEVYFDSRGVPYNPASHSPLTSDLIINITPAGDSAPVKTIRITQFTGFIP